MASEPVSSSLPAPASIESPAWVDRALIAALAVVMLAFSIAPLSNCVRGLKNKDYTLWYATGRTILDGGAIYPKDHRPFPFMYPPAAAALLGVASAGGEVPFVAGLLVVNSAAWLASIVLSIYLATGRAWRQNPLLSVLPTLVVLPFVHDTYLLGQPNLLLLALMLGAFACLRRRWEGGAGLLIALAVGLKAFPVLAVGYLVYRRHWRAVGAVGVGLLGLLLILPMAFRGPANAADDLATWTRGMVLKYDDGGIAQRPERSLSFKNQSLIALANRLLRPVSADGEAKDTWTVHVADLDFRAVNAVIVASALGLCLFYIGTMPRRTRRTDRSDALEGAMLLVLILFFSPLSFNYFYVWLMYPLTVALQLVLEAPAHSKERRALWAWLGGSVAVFALALPFLKVAQAYGNLFVAALLLYIGLGAALRRASSLESGRSNTGGGIPMDLDLRAAARSGRLREFGLPAFALAYVMVVLVVGVSHSWFDWFERRVRVVEPGQLVRGAYQRPGPLTRLIQRERIKTIVTLAPLPLDSLRYRDEAKVVRRTGVRWVTLPIHGSQPTLDEMAAAADLLANRQARPIFFHCIAGHHRSSLALAAYRIRYEHWTADRAWREVAALPWAHPSKDTFDHAQIEAFAAKYGSQVARR